MNRQVTVPVSAMIKNMMYGPLNVGQVSEGQRVIGYDYRTRSLTHLTLTKVVENVWAAGIKVVLPKIGKITLCEPTAVLTPGGDKIIGNRPGKILGTCGLNPRQLIVRDCAGYLSPSVEKSVILSWEGSDVSYLWVEGLLGGTGVEQSEYRGSDGSDVSVEPGGPAD